MFFIYPAFSFIPYPIPSTAYFNVLYKLCIFPSWFLRNLLLSLSFHNLMQRKEMINSPACLRTLCRTWYGDHRWNILTITVVQDYRVTREETEAQRGYQVCPKSSDRKHSHSPARLGSLRNLDSPWTPTLFPFPVRVCPFFSHGEQKSLQPLNLPNKQGLISSSSKCYSDQR